MKALIDPLNLVHYVSSWTKFEDKYYPVYTDIPNSARVCQIEPDDQTFEVAEPFFWQNCSEQIVPDIYYFNTQDQQYYLIPPSVPYPRNQPVVEGAQTI